MSPRGGFRPGAGRPRIEEPRTNMVNVRLTDAELADLEELATAKGVDMSELIRALIKKATARKKSV